MGFRLLAIDESFWPSDMTTRRLQPRTNTTFCRPKKRRTMRVVTVSPLQIITRIGTCEKGHTTVQIVHDNRPNDTLNQLNERLVAKLPFTVDRTVYDVDKLFRIQNCHTQRLEC